MARPVLDMLLQVAVVLSALLAAARAAFTPADNYLVLCGTAANATVDGRTFLGDASLPASTVNPMGQYTGLSTQALETVHRVNMGSPKITPWNDTLGRTWLPDEGFLADSSVTVHRDVPPSTLRWTPGFATAETAPGMVYATATEINTTLMSASTISVQFNMTWKLQATPGSAYLLRLHFCDIVSKAANVLVFNVYVGGWTVLPDYEISRETFSVPAVPLYKDFVLSAKDVKGNITVSIGTSTLGNADPDGVLNGLEIMRMVGSTGGDGATSSQSGSKKTTISIVAGSAVAGATVVMAVALIVLWVRRRKKPEKKPSNTWAAFSASALGSRAHSRSFGKSNSGGARNNTMVNLAEWATQRLKNGELDSIVDQRIAGSIRSESLKKFVDTAEKCLAEYGVERPAIGDVLWCLEFALQLQEASPDSSGTDGTQLVPRSASRFHRNQSTVSDGTEATVSANLGDLDGMSMTRVFSKMIKSEEAR
ncbi:unnamed protein product [Miscanthus lutarioriparius]|uniref:Malectin-like domain-containing protein n=1 Tax=Miscanthus lutarioriparius TaxID=422564 RepID=A0A811MMI1_9POAL|nr:unnamed protein product [Miscanthus lutarioriparius]